MSLLMLFNGQDVGEPPTPPTSEAPVYSVSGVYAPSAGLRAQYKPTDSSLQAVDGIIVPVKGSVR